MRDNPRLSAWRERHRVADIDAALSEALKWCGLIDNAETPSLMLQAAQACPDWGTEWCPACPDCGDEGCPTCGE